MKIIQTAAVTIIITFAFILALVNILGSLALREWVWGIPGALLWVPITVVLTLNFSNFQGTRPVAVMLSRDGEIQPDA